MSHTAPDTLFQNTKWKQAREKFLLELFLLKLLEDHSLLCKWRKKVCLKKLDFFSFGLLLLNLKSMLCSPWV